MNKDDFLKLGLPEDIAVKCESAFSEALERQRAELQNKHAAELLGLRLDNAVDSALATAGARNLKAVRALLELDRVSLGDDGMLSGLSEQIDALVKSDGYLFDKPAVPNLGQGASGEAQAVPVPNLGQSASGETQGGFVPNLVQEKAPSRHFYGFVPGESADGAPKADADFSQMTYSQMVAYAQNNPGVKFG